MVRKEVSREPSDARRAVVLLEQLEPKVQLVLEGQTGLSERLGRLEGRVETGSSELYKLLMDGFKKVYGDFERVDMRFVRVDEQFAGVNARLDALTSRFTAHEQTHAG